MVIWYSWYTISLHWLKYFLSIFFQILEYFGHYSYLFSNKFERCNIPKLKNIYIATDSIWSHFSFGVYIYMFCACRIFQNWCWKYFLTFFTDFLLTLNYKSTIYMVFFLDLAPNWLLDAFNIYLTYFSRKDLFKFLGGISYKYKKISQILAYFGYYVYIIFCHFH